MDYCSCALEMQCLCTENRGYQLKVEAILLVGEYTQTAVDQIISNRVLSAGKIRHLILALGTKKKCIDLATVTTISKE